MLRFAISKAVTGLLSLLMLAGVFAHTANAHFVWVYNDHGQIKVVFGEGLEPDQAEFIGGIAGMKVSSRFGDEAAKAVSFTQHSEDGLGWYSLQNVAPNADLVDVACLYGVFNRGDSAMLLDYNAKYVRLSLGDRLSVSKQLSLDVVPQWVDGKLQLQAYFAGKPLENAEIIAYQIESDTAEAATDKNGTVQFLPNARWIVRAKHVVAESGEHDGQKYDEQRYYCTLVIDPADTPIGTTTIAKEEPSKPQSPVNENKVELAKTKLADLPVGVTSFGGASIGSDIYVLGGQKGRAHSYADSYQNTQLYHLDSAAGSPWTAVGEYRGLQGLGLVSYENDLYAIGGLEARNKEGEDHDLHSIADFARFDFDSKTWTQMPSLPVGLSSFDACVVDSIVYVVGGWTMTGEDSVWSTKLYWFDFAAAEPKWESAEWPYEIRALSVQSVDNKLYAIGGIDSDGEPSAAVYVYNLQSKQWTEGPTLPTEERMNGFGSASIVINGDLYTSVYEGPVYQLNKSGEWSKVYSLEEGRFFHRLFPLSDSGIAIIGGANMSVGKMTEIQVLSIEGTQGASHQESKPVSAK